MEALSQAPSYERRFSAPAEALSSPDSHPAADGFTFEMSDLMLPASALECELFGVPQDSNATVVSTASSSEETPPPAVITTSTMKCRQRKSPSSSTSERRHSLPSSLMLSQTPLGEAVTQPVPEFLCHLFSMLRDPSYADLISWQVPHSDEPDHMGGGVRGVGKIVVHKPESLQDSVLGKYYRHSKYASFQRQLNYFGFKKRLHGGKKGKLSPCSYIHESLTDDVGSLFTLKRRPPAKKRALEADSPIDSALSVVSNEDCTTSSSRNSKKRRPSVETAKPKKTSSKKDKKKKQAQSGKQQVVVSSMPVVVQAEEFGPPLTQSSTTIQSNNCQVQSAPFVRQVTPIVVQQAPKPTPPPVAQPTMQEMLSTSLPPSDILFNDDLDIDSLDDEGVPTWVTDDGKYHYHNVDSSLVDLAMLY